MGTYHPTVGYNFKVEIALPNGNPDVDMRFQEVSGLTATLGEEVLNEGGENRFSHRLPTRATYGDLVLKRGILKDVSTQALAESTLLQWFSEAIENFKFDPVNVLVHLTHINDNPATNVNEFQPLITWSFEKAYPKSWNVTGLNASQSGLVIEEIKLAYQRFRRL